MSLVTDEAKKINKTGTGVWTFSLLSNYWTPSYSSTRRHSIYCDRALASLKAFPGSPKLILYLSLFPSQPSTDMHRPTSTPKLTILERCLYTNLSLSSPTLGFFSILLSSHSPLYKVSSNALFQETFRTLMLILKSTCSIICQIFRSLLCPSLQSFIF